MIRGRGRAPRPPKIYSDVTFKKLQSQIVRQTRLLNRKIFLRAVASSSGHFFREWCWSLTQKFFHYRIGDPTVLSGGWLGVRQVTRQKRRARWLSEVFFYYFITSLSFYIFLHRG
jgi:hypothetical protein